MNVKAVTATRQLNHDMVKSTTTAEEEERVPVALCVISIAIILSCQYILSTSQRPAKPNEEVVRDRSDLHLQRKIHHLITGVLIYVASRFFGRGPGATVLLIFALLCYGFHVLRQHSNAFNTAYLQRFRRLLRPHEVAGTTLPGAYYFLLGSAFSLALFQLRIARLAILHVRQSKCLALKSVGKREVFQCSREFLMLLFLLLLPQVSVGDPAAAFFGTLYGRHKLVTVVGKLGGRKSLEGSIGCCGVAAIATCTVFIIERDFYFDSSEGEGTAVAAAFIALAAGIIAAAAEMLNVGGWDDNLTLPLLSGTFLQLTVSRFL
uniref:Dolichol kinase n=1 Tax=Hyaloperonospora arabidopsidis (strain Emoy2) TaxID=559515 RepID=M4BIN8_HYAAE